MTKDKEIKMKKYVFVSLLIICAGFVFAQTMPTFDAYPSQTQSNGEYILKRPDKTELIKYQAFYKADTDFVAKARLWQSKWREKKGYPIGKSQHGTQYGNYIEETFANHTYSNFLTNQIREDVKKELLELRTTPVFKEDKFLTNLLSSQTLCLNLFCELKNDLKPATDFFKILLPVLEIKEITNIEFEHSPGRRNKNYTNDNTAFDVFIEYLNKNNEKCFLGIEAKYAEQLKNKKVYHSEYKDFTIKSGMFKETWGHLKHSQFNQVWRDHLLSLSMIKTYNKSGKYDNGHFVLLYPEEHTEWKNLINEYKAAYLNDTHNVMEIHLEKMINEIKKQHNNKEWTNELFERYNMKEHDN
jgi:hypothetical protein